MKSKQFIQAELKKIYSIFEGIEIRYEYRDSISTHIIEIKPIELYEGNTEYIVKEIELKNSFSDMFPHEDILFITDDYLTQIRVTELKLTDVKMYYSN